ncbi:MAG TPA: hypothetical protein VIK04_19000 [Solirubrobacteraceae bacterium]
MAIAKSATGVWGDAINRTYAQRNVLAILMMFNRLGNHSRWS